LSLCWLEDGGDYVERTGEQTPAGDRQAVRNLRLKTVRNWILPE
jgi:hypothetical protein